MFFFRICYLVYANVKYFQYILRLFRIIAFCDIQNFKQRKKRTNFEFKSINIFKFCTTTTHCLELQQNYKNKKKFIDKFVYN